jgi:2-keto-4-pentenoate hydratase/2-oxohepta-3-ene-1,7-dioic acid hydratase in catechol pathway
MRLARVLTEEGPALAVERNGDLELLADRAPASIDELAALSGDELEATVAARSQSARELPLLAPLQPSSIVCVGLNYDDHIRETGLERPSVPLLFAKLASSVIGPQEPILIDATISAEVDWEGELAVVIGREARRVSAEEAFDHVFGYTIANDVSARDIQFADGQWLRGKSLATFCPLGPAIVTADEIGDPGALGLRTRVNGELVQDSDTSEMIFGVAELISFCSRHFPLRPGDLLLTGTPWGCGAFREPAVYLQPGDAVEVEIDGIGVLRNPVRAAADAGPPAGAEDVRARVCERLPRRSRSGEQPRDAPS